MRMKLGVKLILVIIVGLFLFPPGFCEDETDKKGEEASLEELLEVKISTAAKYDQTMSEAPASVTIITREEIERYGYRTLDEILMRVRGFYLSNDRNYNYLGVRGFSRPSDYSNRVLLLLNGATTTDNIWGSSTIGSELGLDIDAIERIEIVRGPGSALYGTNAMLAVINIITKTGKTVDGLKLTLQPGSFGKVQGGMRLGKELKNGLDFFVSAHIGDIKGQDLYFEEFDEPQTNNGIAQGLDWDKYHGIFASLKYKNFSLQGLISSREKGVPTASYDTAFNDDRFKTLDSRDFFEIKYNGNISYNTKMMLRGYYHYIRYYGAYPYDDPEYTSLWEEESKEMWLGFETQLSWDIRPDNRLIIGAEYRNHYRVSYLSWDEFQTEFEDDFPFHDYALYIQDEYQVLKNLSLMLGLRYDKYSDRGKASLTPRAALIYNPFTATTLKFLYGNAYRVPNIYETYYEAEDEAKANPLIKREKINTLELVVEQRLSKQVFGILSLYNFEMRGLIEQVIDPADELWQFQNLEKVKGIGVEAELNVKLKNGLMGYLNYNLQHTRNVILDAKITNSPSHIIKLGLSVPVLKHFFTSIETFYESGRITLSGNRTKSFLLTNFHLSSGKLFNLLGFSFQTRNLFDVEYHIPAGYEHTQDTILQNGRSFTFKIELIL
ncbi:MAG: TonB-dependent receptor [Candidatus Aminicenantes bacterium]|nr:MAG: TonB-dependent receptor [Candidatus Aminicenantes bacterium]